MKITSFEEFKDLARRGTFVPVCKEIVADLLTPVSAFLKIAEHADYAFLLESVEGGEHVGRYSFLGKDPFLILRARDGKTTIDRGGVTKVSEQSCVETLRRLMADFRSPFVPELPRFTGGAVGYLGYGAASWFEPTLGDLGASPDAADDAGFMLFDTVLAFDHVQHRILIIANARITPDEDLESLYQFACAKIQFLERELERNLSHTRPDASEALVFTSNHTQRAVRGAGARGEGAHRRRRHLSGRAVAAVRSRGRRRSRSPSIARCATSTRRRTCISSAWAASRWSARRRRCWSGSKARAWRRIRSPARGRAAATRKRTCGSPRS